MQNFSFLFLGDALGEIPKLSCHSQYGSASVPLTSLLAHRGWSWKRKGLIKRPFPTLPFLKLLLFWCPEVRDMRWEKRVIKWLLFNWSWSFPLWSWQFLWWWPLSEWQLNTDSFLGCILWETLQGAPCLLFSVKKICSAVHFHAVNLISTTKQLSKVF